GMRRRSLIVPASASTPTLISGSANRACSSMTMMSQPSTSSKPPPQAMPLTAAMSGLSRLRGWLRPAKPPLPQSSSERSPAAAALRSQPGEKKRSPAPVMMQIRSAGSSRKAVKISFSRRLAARSMALALGRSRVTSRTAPVARVRIPARSLTSDISGLLGKANQCIDGHDTAAGGADEHGIEFELQQSIHILLRIARAGQHRLRERGQISRRPTPVAAEQPADAEPPEGRLNGRRGKGGQQRRGIPQELRENPTRTQHEQSAELRIDCDAHQDFGNGIGHHLLDEESA